MNRETIIKAMEIVFRLKDGGYIDTASHEQFVEWFLRSVALVQAYHGERFQTYDTPNVRMIYVFEYYGKDDPMMWTMAACLLYNDVGDELALSIYERDYGDDDFYVGMGEIFREVLLDEVGSG